MQINEYNQNQGIKKYWLIVYHKQRFVKNVSFYNTFLVFYRLILWLPFYHTNLLPFLTHSSLNSMADLVIQNPIARVKYLYRKKDYLAQHTKCYNM